MDNIFLIGSPCSGKTTISNQLANEKNINVIHMNNLVKETIYPLCDILLTVNGTTQKEKFMSQIQQIEGISKFSKESILKIAELDEKLSKAQVTREEFLKDYNRLNSIRHLLPEELKLTFFSQSADRSKLKELFKINDAINNLINEEMEKENGQGRISMLRQNMPKNQFFEMMTDPDLTIDNYGKIKYYLNCIFKNNTQGNLNLSQITESLGLHISDIRDLGIKEINTTNKFSALIDCINIEHSFDRLEQSEKTPARKEMHDICFKIKEILLLDMVNNSCRNQTMIDVGGGMTYYEGYGKFEQQYEKLKEQVQKVFEGNIVAHILPKEDLETSKQELLERANERGRSADKFKKEIEQHFESKCNEMYATDKMFTARYNNEELDRKDTLEQFDKILTKLELAKPKEAVTKLDKEIEQHKEKEPQVQVRNNNEPQR